MIEYMGYVEQQLGIKQPQDWYNISLKQLQGLGGSALLRYSSLPTILQKLYPEVHWDFDDNNHNSRFKFGKAQFSLASILTQHPVLKEKTKDITTNYLHPEFVFGDTQQNMELDIYVPSAKLGKIDRYDIIQQ